MRHAVRFGLALAGLTMLTGVGTGGYMLIEGAAWLDALYMTVITISTVGYTEVFDLSDAGRVFTMGMIVTSVGLALYLFTTLAELLIEVRVLRLFSGDVMQKQLDALEDHVIICGWGRFGRVVAEELSRASAPFAVIEANPARQPDLARAEVPYLIGSATDDDVLARAGLGRARAVVVATGSDSDNVFITLSAREGNHDVQIHARGESDAAARQLTRAGAHQVVSPHWMGGQRMAASILRPNVVDFLEISRSRVGEQIDLEEIRVETGCSLCGETIGAVEQRMGRLRVTALKRHDARIQLVPPEDLTLEAHDHLVVIGERADLEKLSDLAARTG